MPEEEKKKEQEKKAKKERGPKKPQGKQLRRLVIATDGVNIDIEKSELSVLEICEIARRLLRQYAGDR